MFIQVKSDSPEGVGAIAERLDGQLYRYHIGLTRGLITSAKNR